VLTRIATAVLAGSVALAAILWREPWGLYALLVVVLFAASFEGGRLSPRDDSIITTSIAVVMTGMTLYLAEGTSLLPIFVGFAWLMGLATTIVRSTNGYVQFTSFALWTGCAVLSATYLHVQTREVQGEFGLNLLCLALLPLWVGDSLAYFVGKAIGKHKMAPSISPNKTWEGAVANLLGCLGAAYGIGAWLGVTVVASLAVGLTTGVLGQVGDLLQSRLKRLANVKDSGSILPGHGGILDRLDSFLFSSYPSLLALYLLAPEAFHVKQWPW